MLKTCAVTMLAIAMSAGLADAKGRQHKAAPKVSLAYCENNRQTTANCACGPAKMACRKGAYCHSFMNACTL